MFWTKFCELCEGQGLKPRKIAAEFDVAPATVTRWKHGSVPRGDVLLGIAERLEVDPDYLVDENEVYIDVSAKRSAFKKLTSLPQRWNALHAGYDLDNRSLMDVADYLNCSIFFLTGQIEGDYEPDGKYDTENLKNVEALIKILEILDCCADSDVYRTIQIQISKIVLYHLGKKKWTYKKLCGIKELSSAKLDFLMNGVENIDPTVNFGLNFSEISAIAHKTKLSYIYLFTGVEGDVAEIFA